MEKPSKALERIFKIIRLCAALVGCDVFQPKYHVNVMTIVVATCIIAYYIFASTTIIKLYHEDPNILLEALCLICSVTQGAVKMVSVIMAEKTIKRGQALLTQIYAEYELLGVNYKAVLNASCKRVIRISKIICILYVIGGAGLVVTPIVTLVITGKRYLVMQVIFPYLDVTTNSGYCITFAFHSIMVFAAAFGLFGSDVLVIFFLLQATMFTDIFKLKVKNINEFLENYEQKQNIDAQITHLVKDIVKWHQIYTEFTKSCNKMFFYIVTVVVTTSGGSIILSLLLMLISDWPGTYPYVVGATYSLYVYCILGTKIEICNDEFRTEIYNVSWYKMKASQQKMVRLMLMESQRAKTIYVAGVFPLSVSTALQITKTIYSIFMLMCRFVLK